MEQFSDMLRDARQLFPGAPACTTASSTGGGAQSWPYALYSASGAAADSSKLLAFQNYSAAVQQAGKHASPFPVAAAGSAAPAADGVWSHQHQLKFSTQPAVAPAASLYQTYAAQRAPGEHVVRVSEDPVWPGDFRQQQLGLAASSLHRPQHPYTCATTTPVVSSAPQRQGGSYSSADPSRRSNAHFSQSGPVQFATDVFAAAHRVTAKSVPGASAASHHLQANSATNALNAGHMQRHGYTNSYMPASQASSYYISSSPSGMSNRASLVDPALTDLKNHQLSGSACIDQGSHRLSAPSHVDQNIRQSSGSSLSDLNSQFFAPGRVDLSSQQSSGSGRIDLRSHPSYGSGQVELSSHQSMHQPSGNRIDLSSHQSSGGRVLTSHQSSGGRVDLSSHQSSGGRADLSSHQSSGGRVDPSSHQSSGGRVDLTSHQSSGGRVYLTSHQSSGSRTDLTSHQSSGGRVDLTSHQSSGSRTDLTSHQSSGGRVDLNSHQSSGSRTDLTSHQSSGGRVDLNSHQLSGGRVDLTSHQSSGGRVDHTSHQSSGGRVDLSSHQSSGGRVDLNSHQSSGGRVDLTSYQSSGGRVDPSSHHSSGGRVDLSSHQSSGGRVDLSSHQSSGGRVDLTSYQSSGGRVDRVDLTSHQSSGGRVDFINHPSSGPGRVDLTSHHLSGGRVDLTGHKSSRSDQVDLSSSESHFSVSNLQSRASSVPTSLSKGQQQSWGALGVPGPPSETLRQMLTAKPKPPASATPYCSVSVVGDDRRPTQPLRSWLPPQYVLPPSAGSEQRSVRPAASSQVLPTSLYPQTSLYTKSAPTDARTQLEQRLYTTSAPKDARTQLEQRLYTTSAPTDARTQLEQRLYTTSAPTDARTQLEQRLYTTATPTDARTQLEQRLYTTATPTDARTQLEQRMYTTATPTDARTQLEQRMYTTATPTDARTQLEHRLYTTSAPTDARTQLEQRLYTTATPTDARTQLQLRLPEPVARPDHRAPVQRQASSSSCDGQLLDLRPTGSARTSVEVLDLSVKPRAPSRPCSVTPRRPTRPPSQPRCESLPPPLAASCESLPPPPAGSCSPRPGKRTAPSALGTGSGEGRRPPAKSARLDGDLLQLSEAASLQELLRLGLNGAVAARTPQDLAQMFPNMASAGSPDKTPSVSARPPSAVSGVRAAPPCPGSGEMDIYHSVTEFVNQPSVVPSVQRPAQTPTRLHVAAAPVEFRRAQGPFLTPEQERMLHGQMAIYERQIHQIPSHLAAHQQHQRAAGNTSAASSAAAHPPSTNISAFSSASHHQSPSHAHAAISCSRVRTKAEMKSAHVLPSPVRKSISSDSGKSVFDFDSGSDGEVPVLCHKSPRRETSSSAAGTAGAAGGPPSPPIAAGSSTPPTAGGPPTHPTAGGPPTHPTHVDVDVFGGGWDDMDWSSVCSSLVENVVTNQKLVRSKRSARHQKPTTSKSTHQALAKSESVREHMQHEPDIKVKPLVKQEVVDETSPEKVSVEASSPIKSEVGSNSKLDEVEVDGRALQTSATESVVVKTDVVATVGRRGSSSGSDETAEDADRPGRLAAGRKRRGSQSMYAASLRNASSQRRRRHRSEQPPAVGARPRRAAAGGDKERRGQRRPLRAGGVSRHHRRALPTSAVESQALLIKRRRVKVKPCGDGGEVELKPAAVPPLRLKLNPDCQRWSDGAADKPDAGDIPSILDADWWRDHYTPCDDILVHYSSDYGPVLTRTDSVLQGQAAMSHWPRVRPALRPPAASPVAPHPWSSGWRDEYVRWKVSRCRVPSRLAAAVRPASPPAKETTRSPSKSRLTPRKLNGKVEQKVPAAVPCAVGSGDVGANSARFDCPAAADQPVTPRRRIASGLPSSDVSAICAKVLAADGEVAATSEPGRDRFAVPATTRGCRVEAIERHLLASVRCSLPVDSGSSQTAAADGEHGPTSSTAGRPLVRALVSRYSQLRTGAATAAAPATRWLHTPSLPTPWSEAVLMDTPQPPESLGLPRPQPFRVDLTRRFPAETRGSPLAASTLQPPEDESQLLDAVFGAAAAAGPSAVLSPVVRVRRARRRRGRFKSGLDYMIKRKRRREPDPDLTPPKPKRPALNRVPKPDMTQADLAAELRSWVLNKSAGETLLIRAAKLDRLDAVMHLLESGELSGAAGADALVDCPDNASFTALHEACARGHVDVARTLLMYSADVNVCARGGVRPIHEAIEGGSVETVRLLLSYGADPRTPTYSGASSLELAASGTVISALLRAHLSDIDGCPAGDGESSRTADAHITDHWTPAPANCLRDAGCGMSVCDTTGWLAPGTDDTTLTFDLSSLPLPAIYTLLGAGSSLSDCRLVSLSALAAHLQCTDAAELVQQRPHLPLLSALPDGSDLFCHSLGHRWIGGATGGPWVKLTREVETLLARDRFNMTR